MNGERISQFCYVLFSRAGYKPTPSDWITFVHQIAIHQICFFSEQQSDTPCNIFATCFSNANDGTKTFVSGFSDL